ncbi:MAG: DUF1638 domain-containing protein [Pseudomonadota bacterium]
MTPEQLSRADLRQSRPDLDEPRQDLGAFRLRQGVARPGLIIACGALVRDVQAVMAANGLDATFDIRAVPATYHNRPERIAPAVDRLIKAAKPHYSRIFVAFAECGTRGDLDAVLRNHGVERLPGAHCYAVFSGISAFEVLSQDEISAFYLTDFLARHFKSLVWESLGLDRHPELRDIYFGHYDRLIYLSQAPDPDLVRRAEMAAGDLGLRFEHRPVGYGCLPETLKSAAS